MDDDIPQTARLPITNISQWLERYSVMAAVLATRFQEKALELLAYQALIIRAERNYKGHQWAAYDRQYRWEALSRRDLNLSVPDPWLYNEAFTGRARSIPQCTYCLQDDHLALACPRNLNRLIYGWGPECSPWPPQGPPGYSVYQSPPEICRRFNNGRYKKPTCRYRHTCSGCQGSHVFVDCPDKRAGQAADRSRSPRRLPPRAHPGH